MKKKIIIIIIFLILILVGVYFIFFKKDKIKMTYVEENFFPSTEVMFMKEITNSALENPLNSPFKSNEYKKCEGMALGDKNFYTISASCEEEKNSYTIKHIVNKKSKIDEFVTAKETPGGYFYSGYSSKEKKSYVGFLNLDGSIKWETELAFANTDFKVYDFVVVEDGYILASQNINTDDEPWGVTLLKLDEKGSIITSKAIISTAYMPMLKTNQKQVVLNDGVKVIYIDKDLKEEKYINNIEVIDVDIDSEYIYYLDSEKNMYSYKNEESKKLFKVEEEVNSFDIVNNKFFLIGENAYVYDNNYNKTKTFTYNNLAVKKDEEAGYIISKERFLDNIYINYYANGYLIFDRYDSNLELVNRNVLALQSFEMGNNIINMKMMGGEELSTINYSEKYGAIIKTLYEL